ncbi:MAG TPA: NAD(P)/FAD-dependent oxidoreductase [Pyrinomonadaceae bacterium]|nr:NAD(P)/FAD-dependent oxidoreductase [Pyrinomonadaceae bacterium]
METKVYDVAIVGAGPAGSSAAIRLANAGRSVLLVEQKKFPREKLCGEFVSPECLEHFRELGVSSKIGQVDPSIVTETVFYSRGGRPLHINAEWLTASHGNAIGLSRSCLDQLLLEQARESGADVFEETTGLPVVIGGRPQHIKLRNLEGPDRTVEAGILIDATGRNRGLMRGVEPAGKPRRAEYVAFKVHVRNAEIDKGACELYSYPDGYGGCCEIENNLYNLCFIVRAAQVKKLGNDHERIWREAVLKNARAMEALESAAVAGEWLAVPITKLGVGEPAPTKGLLSVGDAASFIDPFTGSGIALALESSRCAANAIVENKGFEEIAFAYRQKYEATLKRRMRFASYVRVAGRVGWLADGLIWLLGRNESLRKFAAQRSRVNDAGE